MIQSSTISDADFARANAIVDRLYAIFADAGHTEPLVWRIGGSRYIAGVGEDLDVIVHAPAMLLIDYPEDFTLGGSGGLDDNWASFKLDDGGDGWLNLLLVCDKDYFSKWCVAGDVSRFVNIALCRNLPSKHIRIGIHKVIMDGVSPDDAAACDPPPKETTT